MSDPRQLSLIQAAAVREGLLSDAVSLQFADELEQVLVLLNARIRALLREFEAEGGRLVSTRENLRRALALRQDLRTLLEQTGLPTLSAAAIDAPLDRIANAVLKGNAALGESATLGAFDLEALAAFKEVRLAELLSTLGDGMVEDLWRVIVDGVLGVRPVDELLKDIQDLVDGSAAEARTIYDTAVSTYSRMVDQIRSTGEPDELFLYAGPADAKTRPFCRQRVGKVYSRAEIERMDNHQLPDPMLSAGGFNCRHSFKRVSVLDEELQDLHKTKHRLPEVEDQLKRVQVAA